MEKNCPRCGKVTEDIKFRTFGRSVSKDPLLPGEILIRSRIPVCGGCYEICKTYFEQKYKDKISIP